MEVNISSENFLQPFLKNIARGNPLKLVKKAILFLTIKKTLSNYTWALKNSRTYKSLNL